jgi:uracil-DNA glycosylase family 4
LGEDKKGKLEKISLAIRDLTESPLYEYRKENGYRPVPGEGDPDASILLVGEAPGEEEAKTGRPFVGRAGDVLDELLEGIGLRRDQVYITSVLKDRPPGNRDPRAAELRAYRPFLSQQIGVIQPEVIATLGRFALKVILDELKMPQRGQGLSDLHGRALEAEDDYGQVVVVPLYHPAAVFYNPDLQGTLEEDFQTLAKFV